MSDPVNPADPPHRVADENIVRKRATDPRLRIGALDPGGDLRGPPTPPQLVVTPGPAPSLLGLPGQAAPAMPDFDAPTVAQEIPVGGFNVRIETQARPPAPAPPLEIFDVEPATLIDAAPPPPPRVPAAPPPARPPPPPEPPAVGDGIAFNDGAVAPAIRPAIEAPEFTSGGRPRPIRERRATASAMPVPVIDAEASGSGRVRPPVALDPPVEPSTPKPRPVALDPPVEPSTPRARPTSLDPPVEPGSGRVPRPPGLDPEAAPPGRMRSRAGADPNLEPETSGARPRPTTTKAMPLGLIGAAVVLMVGILVVTGGGRSEHRYNLVEERRLADLWLEGGAPTWGAIRQDAVARAVENVGTTVARGMSSHLAGRTPRFLVLGDELTVQTFTLPDATVVVTTAALRRLGSEAQLAALLAHSLGHVDDVAAYLDGAVDVEPAAREGIAGGPPKAAIALVTAAMTAPQPVPRELDVDALALDALAATDHAPAALADVIRNFGVRGGKRRAAWLTLHPDDPARLAAIDKAPAGGRTGETEYANRILDHIGRHGPAAPISSDPPAPAPTAETKHLRTLPPAPPGATPPTPGPPAQRLVPPDEAPPQP